MTTTTAHKRLDEIETHLTPKEWAIRLADEMRKYPDALAHMKALVKLPLHELPVRRPYFAFEKQAAELHPGNKPEDIRARHRLTDTLWREFHTLKLLIRLVNQAMQGKVENIALQAALQLSALHALILEDALANTTTYAAAFTELGKGETTLAEWSHEYTALLQDFYAHRAAVELIQSEHFAGHPILYSELETELTEAARTIESAVATANDYLNGQLDERVTARLKTIWPSALNPSKPVPTVNGLPPSPKNGMHDASREAIESDEEQWERCREEFSEKGQTLTQS